MKNNITSVPKFCSALLKLNYGLVCRQWRTHEFCSRGAGEEGGVRHAQLRKEDREWRSGGGSPLLRGSGGSCNLVQTFHFI